jgi:hypothetical protein
MQSVGDITQITQIIKNYDLRTRYFFRFFPHQFCEVGGLSITYKRTFAKFGLHIIEESRKFLKLRYIFATC